MSSKQSLVLFLPSVLFYFYFILTWGHFFTVFGERGRGREKHGCEREAGISWFLYMPRLGNRMFLCLELEIEHTTGIELGTKQARGPTGNRTHSPLGTEDALTMPHWPGRLLSCFTWALTLVSSDLRILLFGILSHTQPANTFHSCFLVHHLLISLLKQFLVLRFS